METEVNDIPRRTWAPFVGAALAVLTAGSLVVFSLVAQRTSLDGFPERVSAAPADTAAGNPASITIAPVANGRTEDVPADAETDADLDTAAVSLIAVTQTVPTSTVALEATTAPSGSGASDGDALSPRGDAGDFDGRFRADGVLLTSRDGGGSSDREWDGRHGGKHPYKSHDAKSKKRDGKNKNKKSKARGNNGQRHASPPRQNTSARPAHAGSAHGKPRSSSAARPQPSPKRSAKSSGEGSPPAHSSAGGNGKSRGRGHKKR